MVGFSPFALNLQAVADKITDSELAFLKRGSESHGFGAGSGSETKGAYIVCSRMCAKSNFYY